MSWNRTRTLALVLSLMLPLESFALDSDSEQPIAIEADSLDIDDRQGVSVYRGNVRVTQGSILMLADVVTVRSREREVQQVVATGAPASFRQEIEGEDGEVRAQAREITYYPVEDRIILVDEAHLWRGQNEFLGNRIEYDSIQETVHASAAETGEQRVRVIIQPETNGKPDAGGDSEAGREP